MSDRIESATGLPNMQAARGDYQLLDCGNESKLERVGPYTLIRPSPQAVWSPAQGQSAWRQADAEFLRDSDGGGKWQWHNKVARKFDILFADLYFRIRLTNFGHLGLFPEQAENWDWLRTQIRSRLSATNNRNLHVLNLFAYTGGSTLAASQAGAHVVHVDAAKGVVDWARENAHLAHLGQRPIRWLVDDAIKFAKREVRRNNRYHGIILDPPSFGRGPKGEVFKIENDLWDLFDALKQLLADDAFFVLYSCHTPGFTPLVLHNQLTQLLGNRGGIVECSEMIIADAARRPLPSGAYARWLAP